MITARDYELAYAQGELAYAQGVIEAIAEFADVCSRERLPPWAKPQMLLSTWDRVFAICDGFEVNT